MAKQNQSKAQTEQERENRNRNNEANPAKDSFDKKLDGPNRPST